LSPVFHISSDGGSSDWEKGLKLAKECGFEKAKMPVLVAYDDDYGDYEDADADQVPVRPSKSPGF